MTFLKGGFWNSPLGSSWLPNALTSESRGSALRNLFAPRAEEVLDEEARIEAERSAELRRAEAGREEVVARQPICLISELVATRRIMVKWLASVPQ